MTGFPVVLVRLNDGSVVVGNDGAGIPGSAKCYVNRTQAARALAKLDDTYEVYQPRVGRVFYLRKREARS